MLTQAITHTWKRYRSLATNRIQALPIVILMPHSACNCRCQMCDIWKGNKNLKNLNEDDIRGLLVSLGRLGTKQVLLSGGEALLHPRFFSLCRILKNQGLHITLLTTGLTLSKKAEEIISHIDDIIVSIDGDENVHDSIRNVQGAFNKLSAGITAIKSLDEDFPVSSRSVVHRLNYRTWSNTVRAAKKIGVDSISFLPADVSSQAFNRKEPWEEERQQEVLIPREELEELNEVIEHLLKDHEDDFASGFIVESREKIRRIGVYYHAAHGLADYPSKSCNAPWISAVVEPDGNVRPCFFHPVVGNIREDSLHAIVNNPASMNFRNELDMNNNDTCKKCVCSINLPCHKNPVA